MTREQAIEIARAHAKAQPQSYYSEPFQPHEWVISAILAAADENAKDAARYRYLRAGDPNMPRDIDVVDEGMTVIVGDDLDRWCDEGIQLKS